MTAMAVIGIRSVTPMDCVANNGCDNAHDEV